MEVLISKQQTTGSDWLLSFQLQSQTINNDDAKRVADGRIIDNIYIGMKSFSSGKTRDFKGNDQWFMRQFHCLKAQVQQVMNWAFLFIDATNAGYCNLMWYTDSHHENKTLQKH